jgi:hypothetical protein
MEAPKPIERGYRLAAAIQVKGLGGQPNGVRNQGERREAAKNRTREHGNVSSGE